MTYWREEPNTKAVITGYGTNNWKKSDDKEIKLTTQQVEDLSLIHI